MSPDFDTSSIDIRRLLIVGNGFDLAHRMKTTFDNFIESDPSFESRFGMFRGEDGLWRGFENKVGVIVSHIAKNYAVYPDIAEKMDDILREYKPDEHGIPAYYVTGSEFSDRFEGGNAKLAYYDMCFEYFCDEFKRYLVRKYDDTGIRETVKRIDGMERFLGQFSDIISFNYTSTIESLYGRGDVIHIHGDLNEDILLGCKPIDEAENLIITEEYPDIDVFEKSKRGHQERAAYYDEYGRPKYQTESLFRGLKDGCDKEMGEFRDSVESFSKIRNERRQCLIDRFDPEDYSSIAIFGHSLGETDRDFFDIIGNHPDVVCYCIPNDRDSLDKAIKENQWSFKLEISPFFVKS